MNSFVKPNPEPNWVDNDERFEIINGVKRVKNMASQKHGEVQVNVAGELRNLNKASGKGCLIAT